MPAALACAARIVLRCIPNERDGVGGRRASRTAMSEITSAATSVRLWPASASKPSEPATIPKTTWATTIPRFSTEGDDQAPLPLAGDICRHVQMMPHGLAMVAGQLVRIGAGGVDVDVGVVEMADLVEQPVPNFFGDVVAVAHRQVAVDGDGEIGDEAMSEPAGLRGPHLNNPWRCPGNLLDAVDDRQGPRRP